MTNPIDYSRPVGWWCSFCEEDGPCFREQTCISMGCKKIPVFLPVPEGQRPLVEDEVATGEAEVVTFTSLITDQFRISGADIEIEPDGNARGSWSTAGELQRDAVAVVNFCAEQSARARIVTGATE